MDLTFKTERGYVPVGHLEVGDVLRIGLARVQNHLRRCHLSSVDDNGGDALINPGRDSIVDFAVRDLGITLEHDHKAAIPTLQFRRIEEMEQSINVSCRVRVRVFLCSLKTMQCHIFPSHCEGCIGPEAVDEGEASVHWRFWISLY